MTFTIVTPAADRSLLTLAEIKAALGVTNSSRDAELQSLAIEVSDMIAEECGVPRGGLTPPTLRSEVIEETIRFCGSKRELPLSRHFVSAVATITLDGSSIDVATVEIDAVSGMLKRVVSSRQTCWYPGEYVVSYTAGFSDVPSALKRAAIIVARDMDATQGHDQAVKRERIDGIGETEWFQPTSSSGSAISAAAADLIDAYRYWAL